MYTHIKRGKEQCAEDGEKDQYLTSDNGQPN
jgi:hypothetical protein